MFKNLILLLMVLGFSSCYTENKSTIETPDTLLPEETVIEILTDIHLAEGIITNSRLGRPTVNRDFKDSIYQVIFDHYDITPEILTENMDYYNNDLKHMETMYEQVMVNLSKYESEIMIEAKKQDSILNKKEPSVVEED